MIAPMDESKQQRPDDESPDAGLEVPDERVDDLEPDDEQSGEVTGGLWEWKKVEPD
jgi:hypothetical protein